MDVSTYTNREIHSFWSGKRFTFALSLGLFSSSGIDAGSRLLLKSLSGVVDSRRGYRILDAGSGVGAIGVSLTAALPDALVVMQDRDALAVAFSRYNADLNGATGCSAVGGLAFDCFEKISAETPTAEETYVIAPYDLVVSNVPAKAGTPVLTHFCARALDLLAPGGLAALVVVNPLADFFRDTLIAGGGRIVLADAGPGHTVFHAERIGDLPGTPPVVSGFGQADGSVPVIDPAYFRRRDSCELSGSTIELATVYGLPEFDTPSYATALASDVLGSGDLRPHLSGRILLWEPGQGHLAARIAASARPEAMLLAGRDYLSLSIAAVNTRGAGGEGVRARHLPSISDLVDTEAAEQFSCMVVHLDPVPGVPVAEHVVSAATELLEAGGVLVVYGKSQEIHRLVAAAKGFRLLSGKKHRGYRVVALSTFTVRSTPAVSE